MKYFTVREMTLIALLAAVNSVVEISLGSLMHNLKIPFSGSILIVFNLAVYMLVRALVPKYGVIVSTGFITAFIKLVYGSEVLKLGPAMAIFMESALVEALFVFLRNSVFSGALAGGATNVFVLFYPLFSVLVLGGNRGAVTIADVMARISLVGGKFFPGLTLWLGILLTAAFYFAVGLLLGTAAWFFSRQCLKVAAAFRPAGSRAG